jgi:tetratricopeptide (TPR) repeat protein
MARYRSEVLISLFLVGATFLVYGRVTQKDFEFVSYDDYSYVVNNREVHAGLTAHSLRWALTTTRLSSWHPLTWISWQLDAELYGGVKSWGFHRTNLLLHLVNVLLLFWLLRDMTGAIWRSALVAGLFAVHPLHVESVAWVAERKDVLSTLFWILTLWAYLGYARRPALWRYLGVALTLTLGLLAKPMLVTLPFVLLLLDYWPLGRWPGRSGPAGGVPASLGRLILEKLPLLTLAMVCGAMTFYGHSRDGAVETWEQYSLQVRVMNSLVAYVAYIGKLFWPMNLAVFYPHPGTNLPLWKAAGAGVLLAGISVLVLWQRQRRPYLLVGWLWYLGTLVPVIGLVVVGGRAMADRYTYVPFLGLYLLLAWGLGDLAARHRVFGRVLSLTATLGLAGCMILTWIQVRYWHDGKTLWEHTLKATGDNYLAHAHLGIHLVEEAGKEAAAYHFRAAEEKREMAAYHFREAVRLNPDSWRGHSHLAMVLDAEAERLKSQGKTREAQEKTEEALNHYREAVRLQPQMGVLHNILGEALENQRHLTEACAEYREAVRLDPDNANFHCNLATALARQDLYEEAMEEYREALRLDPDSGRAHHNLGEALRRQGRWTEAVVEYRQALRINQESSQTHFNLGLTLWQLGKLEEGVASLRQALCLAEAKKQTRLADEIQQRLLRFEPRLAPRSPNHEETPQETPKGSPDGPPP